MKFKVGDIVFVESNRSEVYLVLAIDMKGEIKEDCLFLLELTHPTNDGRERESNNAFIDKVQEQFNIDVHQIGFNTASCRNNAETVLIIEDPITLLRMNQIILQAKVNNSYFAEVYERFVDLQPN